MKKKRIGGAAAPRWSRADYREALARLVRRQLECAKRGEIGSLLWRVAFGEDCQLIVDYCRILGIATPIPLLEDGIEDFPPTWFVPQGVPLPAERAEWDRTALSSYLFAAEPRHPTTLPAVNLLAVHTIGEWLERWEREPDRKPSKPDDPFRPAAWFAAVKIKDGTLRKWKGERKIRTKKLGSRINLYSVRDAAKLKMIDFDVCVAICSKAEMKQYGDDD